MLFVFDEDGTPSVAKIVDIDPHRRDGPAQARGSSTSSSTRVFPRSGVGTVRRTSSTWRRATGGWLPGRSRARCSWCAAPSPPRVASVAPATSSRWAPSGSIERALQGLDPGHEYRVSLRYARDSRSAGIGPAPMPQLTVGSLDATSQRPPRTRPRGRRHDVRHVRRHVHGRPAVRDAQPHGLRSGRRPDGRRPRRRRHRARLWDVPVHYEFEEGAGTSAANTGIDDSVGAAALTGTTGWGRHRGLRQGAQHAGRRNTNAADLPDNLLQNAENFTASLWVRPDVSSPAGPACSTSVTERATARGPASSRSR